jgi:lipoteichoic acid synthase
MERRESVGRPYRGETSERWRVLLPLWPAWIFLLILVYKLATIGPYLDFAVDAGLTRSRLLGFVAVQDMGLLALVLLVSFLSGVAGRLRFIAGLLALVLLTLYAMDTVLIRELSTRLTLPHLYRYSGELPAVGTFLTTRLVVGILCAIGSAWLLRKWKATLRGAARIVALGVLSAAVGLPWLLSSIRVVDPYLDLGLTNFIRLNQRMVLFRGVSPKALDDGEAACPDVTTRFRDYFSGRVGFADSAIDADSPNIILLISESLSSVDSLRSGGLYDRLPGIDRIAEGGLTFRNLVANGSNTSEALAALLTGMEPLPTRRFEAGMLSRFPVDDEGGPVGRNLVHRLRERGYSTLFLSNAPLSFQENGPWLKAAGFERVEGGEEEAFAGVPRLGFASPPDEYLFARALEVLGELRSPYFLVLLTISLHPPYEVPGSPDFKSGVPLENALGYIDRTTSDFHQTLQRIGFLDSGVLLIVGDHRRMTPLEPEEFQSLGLDSLGRVYGSMVGAGVPEGLLSDDPLNHSDLGAVIDALSLGAPLDVAALGLMNKGYAMGLERPFVSHLLNEDLGLVLVRQPERPPWLVTIRRGLRAGEFGGADGEQCIVAYLIFSSAWLQERQGFQWDR